MDQLIFTQLYLLEEKYNRLKLVLLLLVFLNVALLGILVFPLKPAALDSRDKRPNQRALSANHNKVIMQVKNAFR